MAYFHGKHGKVTWNSSQIPNVTSWSLTTGADTAITTPMDGAAAGTAIWETRLGGLTDSSATVEGIAVTTVDYSLQTAYCGLSAALVLNYDTDSQFTVTSVCTSLTESASIDDAGRISLTFEGNSAVVHS